MFIKLILTNYKTLMITNTGIETIAKNEGMFSSDTVKEYSFEKYFEMRCGDNKYRIISANIGVHQADNFVINCIR